MVMQVSFAIINLTWQNTAKNRFDEVFTLEKHVWGQTPDGEDVVVYELTGTNGMRGKRDELRCQSFDTLCS